MAEVGEHSSLTINNQNFSESDVTESDIFPDLTSNTFKSQKDVSVGKYDYCLGLIEITKSKGAAWRTIGGNIGSKLYLFPEEALFLFECNKLEIIGEIEQLSSEDIWSIMCPSKHAFNLYIVYAHFKKLGYIVIRHGAYKCTHKNIYVEHVREKKDREKAELEAPVKRSKLDGEETVECTKYQFPSASFDIYKSGDYYMKSALLQPDNTVAVVASSERFPSKDEMQRLEQYTNLLLALVTGSNATIYSFKVGLESV